MHGHHHHHHDKETHRKEGNIIIAGKGECFVTVDFHAEKANVKFVKDHVRASCTHNHHPELVEIEIVMASKRRSQAKISWDVNHKTTVQFCIVG